MNLRALFEKLAEVFDEKIEIEEAAKRELKSHNFNCRFDNEHGCLPGSIQEVMRRKSAHAICEDIFEVLV